MRKSLNGHAPKPKNQGPRYVKPPRDPMLNDVSFYLKESGITPAQMARKTGMCRQTCSRIIQGKDDYWPGNATKYFALRAIGLTMVIRPEGANS